MRIVILRITFSLRFVRLLVPDNQTYTFFLKNSFLKFWKSCVDDSLKKIKITVLRYIKI